ncbi:MAG: hypothetical protein Q8896_13165, partial [Bacteroidota bacterium]|nr:hypothetical protein [Bacteroidota bacterium]
MRKFTRDVIVIERSKCLAVKLLVLMALLPWLEIAAVAYSLFGNDIAVLPLSERESSLQSYRIPCMKTKKVYIETYGCQMNVADTEVVLSVLDKAGYTPTLTLDDADLAFMNTCAIRENAEEKVCNRLNHWKGLKRRNPEM